MRTTTSPARRRAEEEEEGEAAEAEAEAEEEEVVEEEGDDLGVVVVGLGLADGPAGVVSEAGGTGTARAQLATAAMTGAPAVTRPGARMRMPQCPLCGSACTRKTRLLTAALPLVVVSSWSTALLPSSSSSVSLSTAIGAPEDGVAADPAPSPGSPARPSPPPPPPALFRVGGCGWWWWGFGLLLAAGLLPPLLPPLTLLAQLAPSRLLSSSSSPMDTVVPEAELAVVMMVQRLSRGLGSRRSSRSASASALSSRCSSAGGRRCCALVMCPRLSAAPSGLCDMHGGKAGFEEASACHIRQSLS